MTHVLHRAARLIETSRDRRRTSRKLEAALRDPHLAKDIGLPHQHRPSQKPELW